MRWLGLVVGVLAAYRLTRVVTTDTITERWRDRLYRWAWVEPDEPERYRAAWLRWHDDEPFPESQGVDEDPTPPQPRTGAARTYVNGLLQCSWCLGVWVSYAVTAFWCWVVRDGVPVALYLVAGAAVAGGQGFIASRSGA